MKAKLEEAGVEVVQLGARRGRSAAQMIVLTAMASSALAHTSAFFRQGKRPRVVDIPGGPAIIEPMGA